MKPITDPDTWRNQTLAALKVFELSGNFASVNVSMHKREVAILPRTRSEWPEFGSEQAWSLALEVFNARASSMVELVISTDHQRAYRTVLEDFAQRAFKDYYGTELTAVILATEEDHVYELNRCISDWINEGFKRLAETSKPNAPEKTGALPPSEAACKFPHRALWLRDRLKERAWDRNDVARLSGPDVKTVQKILDGEFVREGGLEKLVNALNHKKIGKVIRLMDIPSD
jgi:hypothetical protein